MCTQLEDCDTIPAVPINSGQFLPDKLFCPHWCRNDNVARPDWLDGADAALHNT